MLSSCTHPITRGPIPSHITASPTPRTARWEPPQPRPEDQQQDLGSPQTIPGEPRGRGSIQNKIRRKKPRCRRRRKAQGRLEAPQAAAAGLSIPSPAAELRPLGCLRAAAVPETRPAAFLPHSPELYKATRPIPAPLPPRPGVVSCSLLPSGDLVSKHSGASSNHLKKSPKKAPKRPAGRSRSTHAAARGLPAPRGDLTSGDALQQGSFFPFSFIFFRCWGTATQHPGRFHPPLLLLHVSETRV